MLKKLTSLLHSINARRTETGNLPITLGLVLVLSTVGLLLTSMTIVNLRNADLNLSQTAFNSAVTRCTAILENTISQNFPDDLINQVEKGIKTSANGGTGTKISDSQDDTGRTWTQWQAPYSNSSLEELIAKNQSTKDTNAPDVCNTPGDPLKLSISYDKNTAMQITTLGDLTSAESRDDATKISIRVDFQASYKTAKSVENTSRTVYLNHPEIFGTCDPEASSQKTCSLTQNSFIYYITKDGTSVWATSSTK